MWGAESTLHYLQTTWPPGLDKEVPPSTSPRLSADTTNNRPWTRRWLHPVGYALRGVTFICESPTCDSVIRSAPLTRHVSSVSSPASALIITLRFVLRHVPGLFALSLSPSTSCFLFVRYLLVVFTLFIQLFSLFVVVLHCFLSTVGGGF